MNVAPSSAPAASQPVAAGIEGLAWGYRFTEGGDAELLDGAALREAVEKQDDVKVQDVSARLEKEAHRLAGVMYGANGPPGPNGEPPAGPGAEGGAPGGEKKGGKDGGVIDAEFEESPGG